MRKLQSPPTVPLFIRVRPRVKRAFAAEARRLGLGQAQLFERMVAERQPGPASRQGGG